MAQSANKRTPLGIDDFWDKPTPDPLLRCKKWRVQYKLALLAKENKIVDTLLEQKPEVVDLPLEPIYEETMIGSSAQSEGERNARYAQQKMWQNKCHRLIGIGIMCGDKPWPFADRKTVSLLYLSIGVEGRRILNCKNPHILIDTLSTVKFCKILEDALILPRNLIFDRHVSLITKNFGEKQ